MKVAVGILQAVDELCRVRAERKILEEKEEQLSDTVKDYMVRRQLREIETDEHLATMSVRSGGEIDPEDYYEALDGDFDKFISTIKVRKETKKNGQVLGADYYLSKEQLEEITRPTTSYALRIKRLSEEVPIPKPVAKTKVKFA